MDPTRLVVIFYLVATLVVGMFLDHLLGQVWARFGWPDPLLIEGSDWHLSSTIGAVLAVAGAIAAWVHPKTKQLSLDVAKELMLVTWPSLPETRMATFAVLAASLVAAVILFGIDTAAYKLMVDWIPVFWGKL
jgi:preprotein translocase subunit SecE